MTNSVKRESVFGDSNYTWSYGNKNNGNIKTYKVEEPKFAASASSAKTNTETGFAFRTAENFLNSLGKKSNNNVDLSMYEAGLKVYHKKFGEGIINKVEPEGDDLKVDIDFEKSGHKRLMAKYAKLEIIK